MGTIGFKPKNVTKKLVNELPDRARDVLIKRYGLDSGGNAMTLEAIGELYGVTRERVRQIENNSLMKLRKSSVISNYHDVIDELHQKIDTLGGVVGEDELLDHLSTDQETKNHLYFLLSVTDRFKKIKGNNVLKPHWATDHQLASKIPLAIDQLKNDLSADIPMSEEDVLNKFSAYLGEVPLDRRSPDILQRYLGISKSLGRNPLGEWGPTSSPHINLKGIRDYAYLVLRQHGSPMHFSEVTDSIKNLFDKKAHVATTHNELIKDPRFVLVGRGLYALSEWGYKEGVVRDVIKGVLEEYGPLPKEEIIERVMKERYVKPNTILVNLQDSTTFSRMDDGRYTIV